ncbi:MAG: hypothetical protein WCP45_03435 [Verrucomicrobiota bacterium]
MLSAVKQSGQSARTTVARVFRPRPHFQQMLDHGLDPQLNWILPQEEEFPKEVSVAKSVEAD